MELQRTASFNEGLKTGWNIKLIVPDTVVCQTTTKCVIIFNAAIPNYVNYFVKFLSPIKKSFVKAERINDVTLTFQTPYNFPAGKSRVTVHHGDNQNVLCSYTSSFTFQPKADVIHDLLQTVSDPMAFLASTFNLDHFNQDATVAVDVKLEKIFNSNKPNKLHLFTVDQNSRDSKLAQHSKNPTLLHFAARYNLIQLCVSLLDCPGSKDALSIKNEEGNTPYQLALQFQHTDLAKLLESAMNIDNESILSKSINSIFENISSELSQRYKETNRNFLFYEDMNEATFESIYGSKENNETNSVNTPPRAAPRPTNENTTLNTKTPLKAPRIKSPNENSLQVDDSVDDPTYDELPIRRCESVSFKKELNNVTESLAQTNVPQESTNNAFQYRKQSSGSNCSEGISRRQSFSIGDSRKGYRAPVVNTAPPDSKLPFILNNSCIEEIKKKNEERKLILSQRPPFRQPVVKRPTKDLNTSPPQTSPKNLLQVGDEIDDPAYDELPCMKSQPISDYDSKKTLHSQSNNLQGKSLDSVDGRYENTIIFKMNHSDDDNIYDNPKAIPQSRESSPSSDDNLYDVPNKTIARSNSLDYIPVQQLPSFPKQRQPQTIAQNDHIDDIYDSPRSIEFPAGVVIGPQFTQKEIIIMQRGGESWTASTDDISTYAIQTQMQSTQLNDQQRFNKSPVSTNSPQAQDLSSKLDLGNIGKRYSEPAIKIDSNMLARNQRKNMPLPSPPKQTSNSPSRSPLLNKKLPKILPTVQRKPVR